MLCAFSEPVLETASRSSSWRALAYTLIVRSRSACRLNSCTSLGPSWGVVEQERDEALAHGVEVEDAAIGFLLDAGGDHVPIQYPLGV